MILDNKTNSVQILGDDTSRTATIDVTRLAKIASMLTSGLYSDPESAVIVELSNNGVDSIVDSGKDPISNPVVVTLSSPSYSKYMLTIKDNGTGMDKYFFENRFMNYLDSTKEESNEFIGAYGIGGKSWASLKRSVIFTIVKDGIKCKYLCWQGETLIDFDLLSEEETDEENGVLFEMPINSYSEYSTFKTKAKEKLAYYDTVVLIIDGKVWDNKIYRNDLFQYTLNSTLTHMHLCLKDVVYPIAFDKLGIIPIPLPVAIRINLNEKVRVNPARESILYSKETIELIKSKIQKIADFFAEKYNEKVKEPVSFYDNFDTIGTSLKYVELTDKTFEVNCLSCYSTFNPISCIGMVEKPSTWYKSNLDTLLNVFYTKAYINYRSVWKTAKIYENITRWYKDKHKSILIDTDLRGYYKEFLKEKGNNNLFVSYDPKRNLSWYLRNVIGKEPKSKWRTIIQEYQAVQEQTIKDFCLDLRGTQNSKVFEDYVEEKKKWLKENRGMSLGNYKILNKQDGEVTIAYSRPTLIGNSVTFEKRTYKISELAKTPHLVILFDESDKETAKEVAKLVVKQKVAIIGQREYSKIKHNHQFKYWKQMIEEGNKPFRRIVTSILASQVLEKYNTIIGRKASIIQNCLHHIHEDIKSLETYSTLNYCSTTSHIKTAMLDVAGTNNLWDGEIKPVIDRVEKAMETFSFIQYIETPNSWELGRKEEVIRLINQMLLFRKKYFNELKDYVLTYVAPPVEPDLEIISEAIDNLEFSGLGVDEMELEEQLAEEDLDELELNYISEIAEESVPLEDTLVKEELLETI